MVDRLNVGVDNRSEKGSGCLSEQKRVRRRTVKPSTLSIREAAKVIGIGINAAYAAAGRGELPIIQVGDALFRKQLSSDGWLKRAQRAQRKARGSSGAPSPILSRAAKRLWMGDTFRPPQPLLPIFCRCVPCPTGRLMCALF